MKLLRFLAALAAGIAIALMIGEGVDAIEESGGRFVAGLPWFVALLLLALAFGFGSMWLAGRRRP